MPDMRPVHHAHVEQPGLAVAGVAGADDAHPFAVQDLLAANYATAPGDPHGPRARQRS